MKVIYHIKLFLVFATILSFYHIWVVKPVIEDKEYTAYKVFVQDYKEHIGACNNWIMVLAMKHGVNFSVPGRNEVKFDKYFNRPTEEQYMRLIGEISDTK